MPNPPPNSLEWRQYSETRKPPLFARTSWWWTQSCETGLRRPNSLLTGKRTGNFPIFGSFGENRLQNRAYFQRVTSKFPKNRNREIIRHIREWRRREQGIIAAKARVERGAVATDASRSSIVGDSANMPNEIQLPPPELFSNVLTRRQSHSWRRPCRRSWTH